MNIAKKRDRMVHENQAKGARGHLKKAAPLMEQPRQFIQRRDSGH